MAKDQGTYWTPDGWVRGDVPDAWALYMSSEGEPGLGAYETIRCDEEYRNASVRLMRHRSDGDLVLELWMADSSIATVFVSADCGDVFLMTEYLRITRDVMTDHQDTLDALQKAFLAFIRHGHGRETVTEYGQTLEEAARERQHYAERKRRDVEAARKQTQ